MDEFTIILAQLLVHLCIVVSLIRRSCTNTRRSEWLRESHVYKVMYTQIRFDKIINVSNRR